MTLSPTASKNHPLLGTHRSDASEGKEVSVPWISFYLMKKSVEGCATMPWIIRSMEGWCGSCNEVTHTFPTYERLVPISGAVWEVWPRGGSVSLRGLGFVISKAYHIPC